MSDLISRQAAIDALDSFILDETTDVHGDTVREILERLPSAQPERKTSEWLHEYLQTAVDFGIITETQASRLMDMIDDSEDNT